MRFVRRHKGFTFTELLVAMSIMGIVFVPLMSLFTKSSQMLAESGAMLTAVNLGMAEMELVKNLGLTEAQLVSLGAVWSPPESEPPFTFNGTAWRVKRTAVTGSDPLIVRIEVYEEPEPQPTVTLVTRFEDSTTEGVSTTILLPAS